MLLPKRATAPFCPSEVRGSVTIPPSASAMKKWLMIAGPGLLISVGYIDPGNWATDITAGARYGYDLLFIIVLSNIAAMFLQSLAMRVGVVTGRDLAQLSRAAFPRELTFLFWILAELAIVACDIAEVLGAGLAFHLLLGVSMPAGILLTVLDTVVVLGLQGRGFRAIEAIILGLMITVGLCFAVELAISGPDWKSAALGCIPSLDALGTRDRLYLAIGILGATVMPHNLYLHSSLVQTRQFTAKKAQTKEVLFFNNIDTVLALSLAVLINAAILIMAAALFFGSDAGAKITGIEDAYRLLTPILGSTIAVYAFGIGLLASGQSATFTGTIAGQVILEGYLRLKIPCWTRRLITRGLALIPALLGVIFLGDGALNRMMVLSQVFLGLQLPLIMYPLFRFAANKKLMGQFRMRRIEAGCAWALFLVITAANIWLLINLQD